MLVVIPAAFSEHEQEKRRALAQKMGNLAHAPLADFDVYSWYQPTAQRTAHERSAKNRVLHRLV